MKIKILSVGKIKQKFVHEGEAEYVQRLQPFAQVSFQEIEARTELPVASMKKEECEATLSKVHQSDTLIVLDERGKTFSSTELANWLQEQMNRGSSQFCFAIGGASGWAPEMHKSAKLVLSLSKLTFPYQLTRLILVEQIYRALTLIKGIPYHK